MSAGAAVGMAVLIGVNFWPGVAGAVGISGSRQIALRQPASPPHDRRWIFKTCQKPPPGWGKQKFQLASAEEKRYRNEFSEAEKEGPHWKR
jgi:hypothetical protein